MHKTVSIALATYNGEQFLREQLDSIYAQTYQYIEVVVSDDASTDRTGDILAEYAGAKGLRFSVNSETLGYVKNFEKAVSMCTGDLIALSDQDDVWLPEKIETLVRDIGEHSLVCSDAELIDHKGQTLAKSFYHYSGQKFFYDDQFRYLAFNNFVTGCTCLFSRDLAERAFPVPEHFPWHDWWLALAASTHRGIAFVDEPLIKYRQHGSNSIGASRNSSLQEKMNESCIKKSGKYEDEILMLEEMKHYQGFSAADKWVINDRIIFYRNLLDSTFHFRSFFIALKYRRYMFARRGRLSRVLFILGSLVS